MVASDIPHVGSLVGSFLLQQEESRTGCCRIFAALDQSRNVPVTVRVVAPGAAEIERRAFAAFCRTAQTLVRLRHPNLVRAVDCIETPGWAALVSERPAGTWVSDQLAAGPMRRFRLVGLVGPVIEALDSAASEAGILHGNLHPGCILAGADRVVRLAETGLFPLTRFWFAAQAAGSAGSAAPFPAGNPAYVAPEIAAGSPNVDLRADIYSLGAVLYHLLTGQVPFPGRSIQEILTQHISSPVTPPRQVNPLVDAAYSDLVVRMMSKNPAARPQSYDEVLTLVGHMRTQPKGGHLAPAVRPPGSAASAPAPSAPVASAPAPFPPASSPGGAFQTSPAIPTLQTAADIPFPPAIAAAAARIPATGSFAMDSSAVPVRESTVESIPVLDEASASAPAPAPAAPSSSSGSAAGDEDEYEIRYFRGQPMKVKKKKK